VGSTQGGFGDETPLSRQLLEGSLTLKDYYTSYYRDTLGLPEWRELVQQRCEYEGEVRRLFRFLKLVDVRSHPGIVLNVGCGTGGFNRVALSYGVRTIGIDSNHNALIADSLHGVLGVSEELPFRSGEFLGVYCFSVIEHVASVVDSIREMVRVTRPGGAIYIHTPNAWSWYEGHYKVPWVPFMPQWLGRRYLRMRWRPTAYLATIRRLTRGALIRAFQSASVTDLTFYDGDPTRDRMSRWLGVVPYLEVVARV